MLQEKVREQEQELVGLRHSSTQYVALEREAREAMDHVARTTADSKVHTHKHKHTITIGDCEHM